MIDHFIEINFVTPLLGRLAHKAPMKHKLQEI